MRWNFQDLDLDGRTPVGVVATVRSDISEVGTKWTTVYGSRGSRCFRCRSTSSTGTRTFGTGVSTPAAPRGLPTRQKTDEPRSETRPVTEVPRLGPSAPDPKGVPLVPVTLAVPPDSQTCSEDRTQTGYPTHDLRSDGPVGGERRRGRRGAEGPRGDEVAPVGTLGRRGPVRLEAVAGTRATTPPPTGPRSRTTAQVRGRGPSPSGRRRP